MYNIAPDKADEVTRRLARFAREYPDNAAANYYYALSLRGRTAQRNSADANRHAADLLRKAIKLKPDWADAHYQLGLLYEDQAVLNDAIREYQAAVRLQPSLATAHYRLAQLYKKKGQQELAQSEFRVFEALKGKPQ
jgi:tetratricopeptide (TPR) repeat protein